MRINRQEQDEFPHKLPHTHICSIINNQQQQQQHLS